MDLRGLSQIDLNLLVPLHVLLQERHVTRSAQRLRASQPAISRALARLRKYFGDPLLIKSGGELVLTARARDLAPQVEAFLRSAQSLTEITPFDPTTSTGTIRLSAPEDLSLILVPRVLEQMAGHAPGIRLEVLAWHTDLGMRLERGDIDLAIGYGRPNDSSVLSRTLFEQDWAVMLRKGHPALESEWTAQTYCTLEHVLIGGVNQPEDAVEPALASLGLARKIALKTPYPSAGPLLAEDTDFAITTSRYFASQCAGEGRMVVRRPPFSLPRISAPMIWHERTQASLAQQWFRKLVVEVTAKIPLGELLWPEESSP